MKDLDAIIIEIRENTYDNELANLYKKVIKQGERI